MAPSSLWRLLLTVLEAGFCESLSRINPPVFNAGTSASTEDFAHTMISILHSASSMMTFLGPRSRKPVVYPCREDNDREFHWPEEVPAWDSRAVTILGSGLSPDPTKRTMHVLFG